MALVDVLPLQASKVDDSCRKTKFDVQAYNQFCFCTESFPEMNSFMTDANGVKSSPMTNVYLTVLESDYIICKRSCPSCSCPTNQFDCN